MPESKQNEHFNPYSNIPKNDKEATTFLKVYINSEKNFSALKTQKLKALTGLYNVHRSLKKPVIEAWEEVLLADVQTLKFDEEAKKGLSDGIKEVFKNIKTNPHSKKTL